MHKNVSTNVCSSITDNNPTGTNSQNTHHLKNKQNVLGPLTETLVSLKKEQATENT